MLGRELKGRYQIIATLRTGGFGQTYVAEDTHRPGKPKCVVKHLMPATHNPQFMDLARRLFNTEAEILEKLGRHDQIPQLLAYFEDNQEFYLVQEFVPGHPLSEEMLPGKPLTETVVMAILEDVLQILTFVHSFGVIHRDIKPNNIMRRQPDNRLVLIDFGAVKKVRTQLVTSEEAVSSPLTVAIGTGGYIAPEQALGHPRLNSDIYSLGMTAIEALTGISPRELPVDPHTGDIFWPHQGLVNDRLAAILDKMVCKNCTQRYQSTVEVIEALKKVSGFNPSVTSVSNSRVTSDRFDRQEHLGLSPELQAKLEALLGEAIGPMARVILKQTLPQALTPSDLIERLIVHIPAKQQGKFRTSAQALIAAINTKPQRSTATDNLTVNTVPLPSSSNQIDPNFIRRCEQELSNYIGPMATFICQRILKQNPGILPTQLVETLANQIPNPQQASEFRRRLLS
jgi:serine/threonine-protein kinase